MSRGQTLKLFAIVGAIFALVGCGGGTDNPAYAPGTQYPTYAGTACGATTGSSYSAILDSNGSASGNSMTLNLASLNNYQQYPIDQQYGGAVNISGNAGMTLPDLGYYGISNYSFCVSSTNAQTGQQNQGVYDPYSGTIAYMLLSGVVQTQSYSPFGNAPYGAPGYQQPALQQTPVTVLLQNVSIYQGRLSGPVVVQLGYNGPAIQFWADDVLGGGGYYDPSYYY